MVGVSGGGAGDVGIGMSEQQSSGMDLALKLVRGLIDEVKSVADDPARVHAIAAKLHKGIDVLEDALTKPEETKPHDVPDRTAG